MFSGCGRRLRYGWMTKSFTTPMCCIANAALSVCCTGTTSLSGMYTRLSNTSPASSWCLARHEDTSTWSYGFVRPALVFGLPD